MISGLGSSMNIVQVMTCFARAHIQSQHEFLKYFGEDGEDLTSVEEVHCMLESRACVYIALTRAAHEAKKIPNLMSGLKVLGETTSIMSHMSHYMHHALEIGIVSKREAEVVSDTLKEQEAIGAQLQMDAHLGICHPYVERLHRLSLEKTKKGKASPAERKELDEVSAAGLTNMMTTLMKDVTEPGQTLSSEEIDSLTKGAEELMAVLGGRGLGA